MEVFGFGIIDLVQFRPGFFFFLVIVHLRFLSIGCFITIIDFTDLTFGYCGLRF